MGREVLAPFIAALRGEAPATKHVSLQSFNGDELITSPRSLQAIRAEGLKPELLMRSHVAAAVNAQSTRGAGRSKNLDGARAQQEGQRKRLVEDCRQRYKLLAEEAERVYTESLSPSGIEAAVLQREKAQKEKEERSRAAKAKMLDKVVEEQLKTQETKKKAVQRVQEKESMLEARKREKHIKLVEESRRREQAWEERKMAVRAAFEKEQEDIVQKREAKEQAAHEAMRRRQEEEEEAKEVRRLASERKTEEMREKKEKCLSEERARVSLLLEKRERQEANLAKRLAEREEVLQDRAEQLAFRSVVVKQHVDRCRAAETVRIEQALEAFSEKAARADRLVTIREKMKTNQRAINEADRERRRALAHWNANATTTGNFDLPQWLHDPTAKVPPIPSSSVVQVPDRSHHSRWAYNNEVPRCPHECQ